MIEKLIKCVLLCFIVIALLVMGFSVLLYKNMFGYDPKSGFSKEYYYDNTYKVIVDLSNQKQVYKYDSIIDKLYHDHINDKENALNRRISESRVFLYFNLKQGYFLSKKNEYTNWVTVKVRWNKENSPIRKVEGKFLKSLEDQMIKYKVGERVSDNEIVFY